MNRVTWLHPAPHCTLPLTHPARAYESSNKQADVWKTVQPYMNQKEKDNGRNA